MELLSSDKTILDLLTKTLKDMKSAVLAYSGGVDSTFLLKALQLSGIKVLAVTADSETMPPWDIKDAKRMAYEMGIVHRIIKTNELNNENYFKNDPDRCFHCKSELFKELNKIASEEGYQYVIDGSNADDIYDYRPGREAAIKYGVRSPLSECGIKKKEIRQFSKKLGLLTWNKPSSPCLSSRFPYGQQITSDALKRVEQAETFIKSLGFQEIRVRAHNSVARIEVREDEIERMLAPDTRKAVIKALKSIGYQYISLDLQGYRSGSLNEALTQPSWKIRNPKHEIRNSKQVSTKTRSDNIK